MKSWVFAALIGLGVVTSSVGGQAATYHAPAHNYYQNNWMSTGG